MKHGHCHRGHDQGCQAVRDRSRGDGGDRHYEGGRRHRRGHRGGHRGEGHGEHGGGRRSGRLFDHGELRFVVLALIAERPRHGYEIIKEIEERVAGTYSPSPGVVYPTLTMLEEIGHATVDDQGGKKLYAATPDGFAFLDGNRVAVDAAMARMEDFAAEGRSGPAPEIVRAMANVKLALRMRHHGGPLSVEQGRAIAAILDNAAREIEQV